jgi:hypothetical protein
MKLSVIIPLLITTVYAQTQNPLIPSGISSGCSQYLANLDSDPKILSFTKVFNSAVANFGVRSNSSNASASTINSTLNALCPNLPGPQDIKAQLTSFYPACLTELTTSPNADVIRIYDVLYVIFPMSKAACTKHNETYCVLQTASNSAVSANDLWLPLTSKKSRRAEQEVIIPNLEQFVKGNLPVLGIQPSLSTDSLCNPCTRNVLNEYIPFTLDVNYGPGGATGVLMGSENNLYKAVQQKCSSDFLGNTVQVAGGISGGILGSGAADLSVNTRTVAGALSAIVLGFFIAL